MKKQVVGIGHLIKKTKEISDEILTSKKKGHGPQRAKVVSATSWKALGAEPDSESSVS